MKKIVVAFDNKGLTLVELLVAFVISSLIVAAIYSFFTAQNKSYIVQDQVVEVQQGIKGAMDLLSRDLRMAGYDNNNPNSLIGLPGEDPLVKIRDPIIAMDHQISILYEFNDTTLYTITYRLNPTDGTTLERQITTTDNNSNNNPGPWVAVLENVNAFDLEYGIDGPFGEEDGSMDMLAGWKGASDLYATKTVGGVPTTYMIVTPIAVRVTLSARPDQTNEDVRKMISPRTLTAIVNLRNKSLIKTSTT